MARNFFYLDLALMPQSLHNTELAFCEKKWFNKRDYVFEFVGMFGTCSLHETSVPSSNILDSLPQVIYSLSL